MQGDVAESVIEGIGMRHEHDSFRGLTALKKPYSRPVLTSTILTAEEMVDARSSRERMTALGIRLKREGRI